MTKHFKDYVWKGGLPYGITPQEEAAQQSRTYKILMDPYRKRVSIEKYALEQFVSVIYDSALLDFRHLKPTEHMAWQKVVISETGDKTVCLIRNQDDRIAFIETHLFQNELCRECHVHSPHGLLLSVHKMLYKSLNDPWNGVVLYDQNQHPVMYKCYEVDEQTGEFTNLITEDWDISNAKNHLNSFS